MANSISFSPGQSLRDDSSGRRFIFNGDPAAQVNTRVNKKVKRRQVSTLGLILSVLSVALVVVFFTWNKLAVNRLSSEIDSMQIEYDNIVGKNRVLLSTISQKSRPEIIVKIAKEQLGLTYRQEQPVVFELEN